MRTNLFSCAAMLLAAPAAAQDTNPPTISKAEFLSIKNGMKYAEVVKIIGSEGELMSEADSGRVKITMYTWQGEGGPAASGSVVFNNGRVMSKSQYGLK